MPNSAAAAGLAVIVIGYLLIFASLRARRRWLMIGLGCGAVSMWLLASATFLVLIALEAGSGSGPNLWCRIPGQDFA